MVIEHSGVSYTSYPGAGSLYLDDVQVGAFTVQPGQHVWARQLNDEVAQTKITNDGGSLWILGLKTEQPDTVINTTAGGTTELLGALIYPATTTNHPTSDSARRTRMSRISMTSWFTALAADMRSRCRKRDRG